MQPRTQNPQPPSTGNGQLLAGLVEGIARAIALTVEVFLHRGFGSRYVGCGLLGTVIIFVFAQFFPAEDPRPILCFLIAYGVLWLVATVGVLIRYWRGNDRVHSRYNGRPFLWHLLPNWKEQSVKHLEALMVILLGYGVHFLNCPLGDYLMCAASLVFLRGWNLAATRRSRAVEMNDSVIEQRIIGERFRDMQER
jgi:hypothetical protein